MPEYRCSLTRAFPNKGKIFDSVFIWQYTGQRKLVF